MANYEMQIDYSGGTFTFPITPEFFPNLEFQWKRDGKTVAVIDSVPVHGWFSENDPDVLIANFATLQLIASDGRPTVFKFRKESGGTIIYQYNRAHIQNLKTVEEGGGFVNHIEFTFDIQEERGVTFGSLVNVDRTDERIKERDADGTVRNTLQRTVTATGEFGNLAPANSFVKGLRPNLGTQLRESIKEDHFHGIVTGTWTYDETEKELGGTGIRLWRERINRHPGQRSHRFYLTSEAARQASVLLRGGNRQTRIAVSGHVEAYEEAALPATVALISFVENQITAAITDTVLVSPSFGGVYPIEFDVEDRTKPTVFALDYSYEFEFGETAESVRRRGFNTRHVGNQG